MSGTQVSAWQTPNELLTSMETPALVQRNQLMNQQTQQTLNANEMDQLGRASSWVLSLPEGQREAGYATAVKQLRANNFAMKAPDQYPGDNAMQMMSQQGLTAPQRYEYGITVPPGLQAALAGGAPGSAAPAAPGTTAPAAGGGFSSDKETARRQVLQQETGGEANPATALNYVARADPTAYARGATASGKYQFVNSTWREGMQLAGLDPAQYPTARDAPDKVQDQVFDAVYAKYGTKPWEKGPKDWVKDEQGQYQLATVRPPPGSPGGAPVTAAAAPPGGGVVARNPGAVQVAGPGAPPPPAATTAAPGTDLNGPRPLPSIGPGSPVVTPQSLANTPAPTLAPQNQVMPGQPNGPAVAPPPPAAAPPAAPPGPAATPPPQMPPTGQNSPQYRRAMEIQQQITALTPYAALPAAKARIAQLQAEQQLILQTDAVVQVPGVGQVHPLTGKIDNPATPNPNYVFSPDAGGPGVPGFIDTTHTHEPKISPARRLVQRPDGTVIDDTGRVVSPADLPGAQAAATAKAAGTAQGTDVVKQTNAIYEQGREADRSIANIDYGVGQLREAAKGGIPSGYFSQGLATAAAAAKSLGIDTSSLGVDPKAVSSVQTAQKTLAVVAAAILQQALGSAQITDAKVSQYIHTQPGLENDPQALERILGWARTQFVYESEQSKAGAAAAADNNGLLPLNFRAQYYRDHGFAPIYNPSTGETEQPDGQSPGRQMPPAATPPAPAYKEGATATGKDGHKIIFRNGVWVPQ